MRFLCLLILVAALLLAPVHAVGQPARFWLSASAVDPEVTSPPQIDAVAGAKRYLHIWGQPGTSDAGATPPALPSSNLQSFSLNLLASDEIVDFLSDATIIYNPLLNEQENRRRYQFTGVGFDADHALLDGCRANGNTFARGVCSMVGFSLGPVVDPELPQADGIGPTCDPNDPFCKARDNGEPAWLIASVAVQASPIVGSTPLYLQIGPDGLNHQGHVSADTQVVFDPVAGGPLYRAGNEDHRNATLPGDVADAIIHGIDPGQIQQLVFAGQSSDWAEAFGGQTVPRWHNDVVIDPTFSGVVLTVTGSQQANSTRVDGGRLHLAGDASLASDVHVSAGGAISGTGWIGADLTLGGVLEISPEGPLNVVGVSNLQGGLFRLPTDYSQPPGTISDPVTILRASRFVGSFALEPGYHFGDGILLHSIEQTSSSVVVQLRKQQLPDLPGDFDASRRVDGADLLQWQRRFLSGKDGAADLSLWESHLGVGVPSPQAGDFNADARVNGFDFLLWQRGASNTPFSATDLAMWEQHAGAAGLAAHTSVPEPEGILCWFLSVGVTFARYGGTRANARIA